MEWRGGDLALLGLPIDPTTYALEGPEVDMRPLTPPEEPPILSDNGSMTCISPASHLAPTWHGKSGPRGDEIRNSRQLVARMSLVRGN